MSTEAKQRIEALTAQISEMIAEAIKVEVPGYGTPVSLKEAANRPNGSISAIYQFDAEQCIEFMDKQNRQIEALNRKIVEYDRSLHLKAAKAHEFPDIGPDPLKLDGEEREKAYDDTDARLHKACAVQQKGVPDQTALVWRIDLSRHFANYAVMQARAGQWMDQRGKLKKYAEELPNAIKTAMKDPGQFIARDKDESVSNWENRAITAAIERAKLAAGLP
jgi:hypothetical protein